MLRAQRCHDHFHLCVSRRLISIQTWPHEPSSPSACEANTTSMIDQNLTNTAAIQTCTQTPSELSLGNNRSFFGAADGAVEEVGERK
ncbi:hypothetical protein D3C76_771880 [compost metagenome]